MKKRITNVKLGPSRTLTFSVLAAASSLTLPMQAQTIDLSQLGTIHPGFRIDGVDAGDCSGFSVSGAGDVNGDGLADLIIGAFRASPGDDTYAGESYVVFGKVDGTVIDLENLGSNGFRIDGIDTRDASGFSVSGAGDVNADGLADLVIGAAGGDPSGDSDAGESYVVFGKADSLAIDLANLGNKGFRIDGINETDLSGNSVSGAGDVNGDGFADLIIGAPGGDSEDDTGVGESYVVFGKADSQVIDLANLGSNGFRITGINMSDVSGSSVSGAGDVNGDGLADLIVGAYRADPDDNNLSGESYVVFGKVDNATIELGDLGSNGFRISGANAYDASGYSVSGAGDVNGDGLADLIVGAPFASANGKGNSGKSYVVFGKVNGVPIDLGNLGSNGFRIDGANGEDRSGYSVSGAGDVNGDGLADLIVSAHRDGLIINTETGESYVIFGKNDNATIDLENIGSSGFRIDGIDAGDNSGRSVSGAGDVNGDGLADLIVGSEKADPGGKESAGESYVIFSPSTAPPSATYRSYALAGNAPRVAIGITGDGSNDSTPDSRVFIDFADGANVSFQTVTLNRSNADISNLSDTANVLWEISTDRTEWSEVRVTFKYLDSEIVSLNEADLKLFQSTVPSGPWTEVSGRTLDQNRNQISGNISSLGFFAITESTDTAPPSVWAVTK